MEFLSPEVLEKFLMPKDLLNMAIIYFILQKKFSPLVEATSSHLTVIEKTLKSIGEKIEGLSTSLTSLEESQTKKLNDLGDRVSVIESKLDNK